MRLKDRIEVWLWWRIDALMAFQIRRMRAVPRETWKAILEQTWLFSYRQDAQKKLGVEILYNKKENKLVSRITRQVKKC